MGLCQHLLSCCCVIIPEKHMAVRTLLLSVVPHHWYQPAELGCASLPSSKSKVQAPDSSVSYTRSSCQWLTKNLLVLVVTSRKTVRIADCHYVYEILLKQIVNPAKLYLFKMQSVSLFLTGLQSSSGLWTDQVCEQYGSEICSFSQSLVMVKWNFNWVFKVIN